MTPDQQTAQEKVLNTNLWSPQTNSALRNSIPPPNTQRKRAPEVGEGGRQGQQAHSSELSRQKEPATEKRPAPAASPAEPGALGPRAGLAYKDPRWKHTNHHPDGVWCLGTAGLSQGSQPFRPQTPTTSHAGVKPEKHSHAQDGQSRPLGRGLPTLEGFRWPGLLVKRGGASLVGRRRPQRTDAHPALKPKNLAGPSAQPGLPASHTCEDRPASAPTPCLTYFCLATLRGKKLPA